VKNLTKINKKRSAGRPAKDITKIIYEAVLDELSVHGASGVSIERVAEKASVNKTSIYRKFENIDNMIVETIKYSLKFSVSEFKYEKSLNNTLVKIGSEYAKFISSKKGQALYLVSLSPKYASFIEQIENDSELKEPQNVLEMVSTAISNGEWKKAPKEIETIFTLLMGAISYRIMMNRKKVSKSWIQTIVNTILDGV
jgi:AcrR family transcriptional regulator